MNFSKAYALLFACIRVCIYSNSCRQFSAVNKLLVNSSFLAVQYTGISQCAKLCLEYNFCSSISYLITQLECRLNYFNDTTVPGLLVQYDKGVYQNLDDILQEFGIMRLHSCPLNTRYIITKRSRGICIPIRKKFDQLKNIAVGKTAKQSSIYDNSVLAYGRKAVDGIWDSDYFRSGCFHSLLESNAWWSVDLNLPYPVVRVVILNRLTEGHRLRNVFFLAGLHDNEMEEFGTFPGPGTNGQKITLSRNVLKFVRFIKIEQRTHDYFHLCEVGIYAPYAEK